MSTQFEDDFKKFQLKIHNFVRDTNFQAKTQEYNELFNQMASIAPDDMKEYVERSPDFLKYRNKSLAMMERIVEIHNNLERIFKLDATALELECKGKLENIDAVIGKEVQEAAKLLHQFHDVSEKGRTLIEKLDDPFLSQAH